MRLIYYLKKSKKGLTFLERIERSNFNENQDVQSLFLELIKKGLTIRKKLKKRSFQKDSRFISENQR